MGKLIPFKYFGSNGVVPNPIKGIQVSGAPGSAATGYDIGTIAVDPATQSAWMLMGKPSGSAAWEPLGGGTTAVDSLGADSGSAAPVGGVINIIGTANQIVTAGASDDITISLPAAVSVTTSVTSDSFITSSATLGVTYNDNAISATGSDANIPISLEPKGSGVVTSSTGFTATDGDITLGTAGNKIMSTSVASSGTAGANSFGTVTLVAGTATVSTTAVTANSIIYLTRQSVGSTGANDLGILSVGTITAATSFVINAWTVTDATALQADDVSVIGWFIVN